MPLQQLAEYFNDRFTLEYGFNFRPILLENGLASGLFGPIKINSAFAPFRQVTKPELITGYSAHINLQTYDPLLLRATQLDSFLLTTQINKTSNVESIINFDRLARTVHMLNYLIIAHLHQPLFLTVDPRHILAIKGNHGAYFEEVIHKCGLVTENVVIVTSILDTYGTPHYAALQAGLHNYQQRGYQIALHFSQLALWEKIKSYVRDFNANYVIFSVRDFEDRLIFKELTQKLSNLKKQLTETNAKIILRYIQERKSASIASDTTVDWVEGSFYRNITFDYRKHLKINTYRPEIFNY